MIDSVELAGVVYYIHFTTVRGEKIQVGIEYTGFEEYPVHGMYSCMHSLVKSGNSHLIRVVKLTNKENTYLLTCPNLKLNGFWIGKSINISESNGRSQRGRQGV